MFDADTGVAEGWLRSREVSAMLFGKRKAPGYQAPVAREVIKERRWVPKHEIEIGMYVLELDKPWLKTKFLFQGFPIYSKDLLEQVQANCEWAYVQSQRVVNRGHARFSTESASLSLGMQPNRPRR